MTYKNKLLGRCAKEYMHQNFVTLDNAALFKVSSDITHNGEANAWDFYLPESLQVAQGADEALLKEVAYYFFVMTATQFCFWTCDEDGFNHWLYQDNPKLKGSSGMAQLMIDQFDQKKFPGLHLKEIGTLSYYFNLFKNENMPHAAIRAEILASLADYDDFLEFVWPKLNGKTLWTASDAHYVSNVYSLAYLDPFLKKSQLFLGMLHENFRARGLDLKTDLSAYADYRLPQVLRHLGVLNYNKELSEMIDEGGFLNKDSDMERAIRAATLLACEQLSDISGLSLSVVDAYLFLKARDAAFMKNIKPFHLCDTTCY